MGRRTRGAAVRAALLLTLALYRTVVSEECYLREGRCIYHVQLEPECRKATKSNRVDYLKDEKVDEMEKKMLHVHEDHARKIAELENKIAQMHTQYAGGGGFSFAPSRGNDANLENSVEGRSEGKLLQLLQNEFSGIRSELQKTARRLRHTERQLDINSAALNKTETALLSTTTKLLRVENKYHEMRSARDKLQRQLRHKRRELSSTQTQLNKTREILEEKKINISELEAKNKLLTEKLEEKTALLAEAQAALESSRSENIQVSGDLQLAQTQLAEMEEQLNSCYQGKTTVFCGFEDERMCGFINDNETDSYDWTRHHGPTSSRGTGPTVDHTCRNPRGHYLYVESTRTLEGQRARMMSPVFRAFQDQCVSFYYHMYGYHIGTLNVFTKVSIGRAAPLWRAYGNQGNVWIKAYIDVPKETAVKGFQVIFEAILGNGYQGDIAIDDFNIADGKCHTAG